MYESHDGCSNQHSLPVSVTESLKGYSGNARHQTGPTLFIVLPVCRTSSGTIDAQWCVSSSCRRLLRSDVCVSVTVGNGCESFIPTRQLMDAVKDFGQTNLDRKLCK
jgi:hypothetical protein